MGKDGDDSIKNIQIMIESIQPFGKFSIMRDGENLIIETDFDIESLPHHHMKLFHDVVDKAFLYEYIEEEPTSEHHGTLSFLIDFLMSTEDANDLRINLDEMTEIWIERHGYKKAKWIRFRQFVRVLFGRLLSPTVGFIDKVLSAVSKLS